MATTDQATDLRYARYMEQTESRVSLIETTKYSIFLDRLRLAENIPCRVESRVLGIMRLSWSMKLSYSGKINEMKC